MVLSSHSFFSLRCFFESIETAIETLNLHKSNVHSLLPSRSLEALRSSHEWKQFRD